MVTAFAAARSSTLPVAQQQASAAATRPAAGAARGAQPRPACGAGDHRGRHLAVLFGVCLVAHAQRRGWRAALAAGGVLRRGRGSRSQSAALQAKADGADRGGPLVAFILGGPGSGKGTQCERVVEEFGYTHLSAGDLLRAERKREGSELGDMIESTIRSGGVVPGTVIAALLEQAMQEAGWGAKKFVIDGYPRSADQLEGWESTLGKKVRFMFCLSLDVGQEEMKRRLLGRGESSGRIDDNEETIVRRFVTFEQETGPVVHYYESKSLLRRIDGERSPDEVWADVRALVAAEEEKAAMAPASGEVK